MNVSEKKSRFLCIAIKDGKCVEDNEMLDILKSNRKYIQKGDIWSRYLACIKGCRFTINVVYQNSEECKGAIDLGNIKDNIKYSVYNIKYSVYGGMHSSMSAEEIAANLEDDHPYRKATYTTTGPGMIASSCLFAILGENRKKHTASPTILTDFYSREHMLEFAKIIGIVYWYETKRVDFVVTVFDTSENSAAIYI